jgi:ubiquinone/menaquinone biosynthesis C-methylase UbiE
MAALEKLYDLDRFIKIDNTPDQIKKYYRINNWAYHHFHSLDGFMHFRMSKNGCFNDDDIYYQPDSISEYIKPGNVVMELGFGHGSNLLYLAHCHPDVNFIGLDLSPLKCKEIPSNVTTYTMNYNDLSRFDDNSVDVLYAIETIVHNSDKENIFRQVKRILKPGGVAIVYDYGLKQSFESYEPVFQRAISILKGPACDMIESFDELNTHFTNCGLQIEEADDYTRETLPDLKRLERLAAKVIERPWLAKLSSWLLPDMFVVNIVIGYLGFDGANGNIGSYYEWILRKPASSK